MEKDRWDTVEKGLKRMRFDRSPFVPANLDEWVQHRTAYAVCQATFEKRRLVHKELLVKKGFTTGRYTIRRALGGRIFNDNRGFVLSHSSIWSPRCITLGHRQTAPWPPMDELKEEGDERHTSGFGRFLPIPRAPGNETVAWKQKAFVPASPMDCVYPVPLKQERSPLSSPLDCPSPAIDLFRRTHVFYGNEWGCAIHTDVASETAHWDATAEAIIRFLVDDGLMDKEIKETETGADLAVASSLRQTSLAGRRGINLEALSLHDEKESNVPADLPYSTNEVKTANSEGVITEDKK